jgi:hypothetical protein
VTKTALGALVLIRTLSLSLTVLAYGTKQMAADANETFTMPDATADATRSLYLKITSAVSLTATREVTLGPNTVSKTWIIENATSGSQIITIKQGSGATVNVPNGSKVMVVTDGAGAGAAVFNANPTEVGGTVTSIDVSGGTTGLTTSGGPVTTSGTITLAGTLAVANGGTGSTTAAGALINFGLTATAAELNYTDGVTSNIQTQLDTKAPTASPTFTGTVTIPTADINGGTIDGTVIGGSTAAAGTFTTGQFNTSLNVDGTATMDGLTVDGNSRINGDFTIDTAPRGFSFASSLEMGSGGSLAVFGNANTILMSNIYFASDATYKVINTGYSAAVHQLFNGSHIFATASAAGTAGSSIDVFTRMNIAKTGDISFYEDTGTTAKLTWSAANESLTFGTNLAITTNEIDVATGDLTLDVAGDIILDADGGDVSFRDAGVEYGRITNNATNLQIYSAVQDVDIQFKGNDGGSAITALTLDMSAAGAATFNSNVILPDNSYFLFGDTTSGIQGNSSSDFIKFYTANTERLLIAGNGDISFYEDTGTTPKFFWDASAESLGIGTTSPTYKLHVRSDDASDDVAYIHHDNASQSSGTLLKVRSDAGASSGYSLLDVQNNSGTALYVAGDNKVGIGTSSPDSKIHLNDGALHIQQTDGSDTWFGLGANNDNYITTGASGITVFRAVGTERMRIASNGDISFYEDTGTTPKFFWDASAEALGIGTTTVTTTIDVNASPATGSGASNTNTIGAAFASLHGNTSGNDQAFAIRTTGSQLNGISGSAFASQVYAPANNNALEVFTGGATPLVFGTSATERLRIDSSGNLLVGKTSDNFTIEGFSARQNASAAAANVTMTRDSDHALAVNRLTNDGDLVKFYKNSTTVGSIGVDNNDNFVIEGNSTHGGLQIATNVILPHKNGALIDNTIGLGNGDNRFKDLYLSGGVYLGGTVAANLLDDYEEGTWTPTILSAGGGSNGSALLINCTYTKTGNRVLLTGTLLNINTTSMTAGGFRVGGLPFAAVTVTYSQNLVSLGSNQITTDEGGMYGVVSSGGTAMVIYNEIAAAAQPIVTIADITSGDGDLFISMMYQTTA